MNISLLDAFIKAELLSNRKISVPKEINMFSMSNAGPDAGMRTIVFSFNGRGVKLEVTREKNVFSLKKKNGVFQIFKNNSLYVDDVKILQAPFHAPNQIFISLSNRCIYDCRFCVSNCLRRINYSPEKWVDFVINALSDVNSVSITSSIPEHPGKTVEDIVYIIRRIRECSNIPVGVEAYTTDFSDIDKLKDAGADELKINIQSYDRNIFSKICPDLDYNRILKILEYGVDVFGKNKVCSNIIIGMGEPDENVLKGVEELASIGAVANIRMLRVNRYNRVSLENSIGSLENVSPERLISLAFSQKEILEKYHLTTRFRTMCHACTCCDIEPWRDV
ncbi:MAG: radical SAM protein [Candidatus Thermoplasmatota archaeon]|nr:radical SAM protein [Candidatus Thermoplasmatota archaeon]MBU4255938.1 radical SAM protein [Candidatus Thermoplasmatota archaeon]MCG2827167.1 radical SAM protein [Thermoplasmatales archaeon]